MNEILREHIEKTKYAAGTLEGLELLDLEFKHENYYAANTYLVALSYIRVLEDKLQALEAEKGK